MGTRNHERRLGPCSVLLAAFAAIESHAAVRAEAALEAANILFIPNEGQLDLPASLYALGGDRIALFQPSKVAVVMRHDAEEGDPQGSSEISPDLIVLYFVGAREGVEPVGEEPSGGTYN